MARKRVQVSVARRSNDQQHLQIFWTQSVSFLITAAAIVSVIWLIL